MCGKHSFGKVLGLGLGVVVAGSLLTGCSSDGNMSSNDNSMMSSNHNSMAMASTSDKNIIQTATGKGMQRVTTLVTAIKAAGLVKALEGPGPFTVFAPTNAAFAKLPKGTLQKLLEPQNKQELQHILLYHVHKGDAIMAKDVKTMSLSTMDGEPVHVRVTNHGVMVNDAKVVKTDIVCSNGVIHWINKVLLPKNMMNN